MKALNRQALFVRGARQVGKTSFVLNALADLGEYPQIKINLLYPSSFTLAGVRYFGRDFAGPDEGGQELLRNIALELGRPISAAQPAIVFVDEVDQWPRIMEAVQILAEFSDSLKFVFTGSNLENITVKNAATGRKRYFDLYPITFREFLQAAGEEKALIFFENLSAKRAASSELYERRLRELHAVHIRLGGMPAVVSLYLAGPAGQADIPSQMTDLAVTVEENVKTVLGEKVRLYEYHDVLRTLARLSLNTLKFKHLQVDHAGRSEAKRLVHKTVGARVAHKVRLWEAESDRSKYILFDTGMVNYLLAGSDLLRNRLTAEELGILYETGAGNALIAGLPARDDLWYWKSGNRAEVEFLLRSPVMLGIDVKTGSGSTRSLNSLAALQPEVACLAKIGDFALRLNPRHAVPPQPGGVKRQLPLLHVPHYLVSRLPELAGEAA